MPRIEEMIDNENVSHETIENENADIITEQEEVGEGKSVLEWLNTPTGEGSVNDRLDHALNFNHSQGMAKIIRGLEGLFDNLNLAIIDIVAGTMELIGDRKKQPKGVPTNVQY